MYEDDFLEMQYEDRIAGIVPDEEVFDYGDEKEFVESDSDNDWFDSVDYGDE